MGRVERSIVIKAPPKKIWGMLAMDKLQEWDEGLQKSVKSIEFISEVDTPEDKYKVGPSARMTENSGKEFVMEVKESLVNEKIVYQSGMMSMVITYEIEPAIEGTKLTKIIDYELPYGFFGGFLDKLAGQRMLGKETERSSENLKGILEK